MYEHLRTKTSQELDLLGTALCLLQFHRGTQLLHRGWGRSSRCCTPCFHMFLFNIYRSQSNIPMSWPSQDPSWDRGLTILGFPWPNYIPGYARAIFAFYNPASCSAKAKMDVLQVRLVRKSLQLCFCIALYKKNWNIWTRDYLSSNYVACTVITSEQCATICYCSHVSCNHVISVSDVLHRSGSVFDGGFSKKWPKNLGSSKWKILSCGDTRNRTGDLF